MFQTLEFTGERVILESADIKYTKPYRRALTTF